MKAGTENRKQVIAMVVLLAIAIPLVLYNFKDMFSGGRASAAPSVAPVASKARPGGFPKQDTSDPRLRLDILDYSRKVKLETGGRNIFTMEAEIPKVEGPGVRAQKDEMGPKFWTPTPTPPPPPIPIKYYGFANKPGESKKVFLQQQGGEEVFVARQGDIVARRYRLVQISANSVTMEDVLTNNRQSIPLTVR